MSDSEIVALFCDQDEDAVRAAEKEYGRYLTAIAERILTDAEDAREAVNDTYLAAWHSVPEIKPEKLSLFLRKAVPWRKLSRPTLSRTAARPCPSGKNGRRISSIR